MILRRSCESHVTNKHDDGEKGSKIARCQKGFYDDITLALLHKSETK